MTDADCAEGADTAALDPRTLMRELRIFAEAHTGRSFWELAITLVPFVCIIALMLFAVQAGHYLALALVPLAGLFLLRIFIIQHDCGHGAFLPGRIGNDWTGRVLGVLTFTPYDCWKRSHAMHHASTGNLDARGYGDVDTLTVREFQAATRSQRLLYRLYRHPVVLFGIGPAYLFLLRHRLPIGLMDKGAIYWVSAMATNLAIIAILGGLAYAFGLGTTTLVVLPVLLVAASLGVLLFYVQHQFEHAHWDDTDNWSFHQAALYGSSHLDLAQPLRWFSGNIGVHHVHHLASRIPFYRLPEVLAANPGLHNLNRFTARETLGPLRLALWSEDQRRMITFREASRGISGVAA
ncbi:MAG: fatty acid desaturase [Erythrobacteraceae bacterium]|jgi:omega-6 fatty acid desaturase (delta-12 desaturase)|nr:fatty acid desaturase [Erythrobacteraceae bacterium]